MHIKKEIRIVGVDDCRLEPSTRVIGLVFRGASFIDGMISFFVKKDGRDATEKLISSFMNSRHRDQINVIMLKGITVAGFNFFDISRISRETGKPVVVVMRKPPGPDFYEAAAKMGIMKAVESAGELRSHGELWIQKSGCSWDFAFQLVDMTSVHGNIPEPLRVAHIIASGLSGDSHGRA